jgi:hypothetical protein
MGNSIAPKTAIAQTQKLAERKGMHGQIIQTPYITYTEFQSTSVGREEITSKSSEKSLTFSDIVSVSSLDEVIRLFGEPKHFNRATFPDGKTVRADLNFGGMKMEYIKVSGSSYFSLRELKVTSPEWSLTVGEKELCPGMSVNQLSPLVRKSGYMYVAKKGTAKNAKRSGELEITDARTQITFEIDEDTGTVKTIRFHQII